MGGGERQSNQEVGGSTFGWVMETVGAFGAK